MSLGQPTTPPLNPSFAKGYMYVKYFFIDEVSEFPFFLELCVTLAISLICLSLSYWPGTVFIYLYKVYKRCGYPVISILGTLYFPGKSKKNERTKKKFV